MEAEQYFTTLYKTQVNELTDEVDDAKERDRENQNDKEALVLQIKSLVARADNDARYVFFFKCIFCPKAISFKQHLLANPNKTVKPNELSQNSFILGKFLTFSIFIDPYKNFQNSNIDLLSTKIHTSFRFCLCF